MQKAKLDILENIPDLDITLRADVALEGAGIASTGEKRWAFNKLIFIAAPVVVLLLIVGGFLIYFLSRTPVTSIQDTIATQSEEEVSRENLFDDHINRYQPVEKIMPVRFAHFNDFIIDLPDTAGKTRVLMCDVAVDVAENQNMQELENNTDIRKIIYRVAQTRTSVSLRSVEERKKLKIEMADEIKKLLGDSSVKNVYFTNYFIM